MFLFDIFINDFSLLHVYTLLTLFLIFIIYRRGTRNHDIWLKNGIPGPKPLPFYGNALEALCNDPTQLTNDRYRKYGDIYGLFLNNIPILSIARPDLIKKITVEDFNTFTNRPLIEFECDSILRLAISTAKDDKWMFLRSIITQSMSIGKIKKVYHLINECINLVIDDLTKHKNSDVDLHETFSEFTKNVSCSYFFSIKPGPRSMQSFVDHLSLLVRPTLFRYFLLLTLPSKLFKILGISFIDNHSKNYFKQLFQVVLKETSNAEPNTFAKAFMENVEKIRNDKNTKISITGDDVYGQLLILLIGSFETTKLALSLIVFHLALYPDVQENLYNEIYEHNQKFAKFNIDNCNRDELPYLHAVIDEVLRLHQINIILQRECKEDYCIKELNGLILPKGSYIQIPLSALARDNKYFEDADQFKPERFLPENIDKIGRNVYIPFGIGRRICVGMNIARIEIKALIYQLVLNFKFERSSNAPDSVEYIRVPFSFLLFTKNLHAKVVKRISNFVPFE